MSARSESPPPGAKRLVFTITSGRSGTQYLARALALFPSVRAVHEPKPRFSSVFRAVCAVPAVAREFWTAEKLAAVHHHRKPIYVETSHLACKGFLESLVDLGYRPDLIHLRRDPRAVASSLWSLGAIPGRTLRGVRHFLAPSDPNHLPIAEAAAKRWNDYQLCYWTCLEIEARAAHYRTLFAGIGIRVHPVDLATIVTPEGLLALADALDLGPLGALGRVRIESVCARRWNEKRGQKQSERLPAGELDGWEAEVRELAGTG